MSQIHYDIIIIGSGIAGLYAAYNIQKMSPSTSFIVLEKYKKNWIGGRTSNDVFYGTRIVTGAGIGYCEKIYLCDAWYCPLLFRRRASLTPRAATPTATRWCAPR